MTYGVQPTGYVRKPLSVILSELEAAMITQFGPDVIQTPQSPLGQWNGIGADLAAELDERAQDVYQSYDPDQTESTRLDTLAAIRGLSRGTGQTDAQLSRAITNRDNVRIGILDRLQAIRAVSGVTWASLNENSTGFRNGAGIPGHTLAFAVIGGSDADVAVAVFENTIPGVGLFGDVSIETAVNGFCRQINFIRPVDIPVYVSLNIRIVRETCVCGHLSPDGIIAYLDNYVNGDCGLLNGDFVDYHRLNTIISSLGGISLTSALIGVDENNMKDEGYQSTIFERPVIVAKNVSMSFV